MIEFENVSFSYTGQEHGGLHDINLKISDGECVLFCGRSGCGKTTITRLVNGLIPQFYQGELHGRVLVDGQEISNIPMYQIAAKVGSVFQNPRTQFFNVDTDSEIAFGIENEARPPKKLAERVEQTTEDLHIQKLRNRNIFELSGGEKQKIAFASVYAMNPQIYLLDEPSSNLDMTSIQELKEHLRLIKKQGKTVLIAEHRLYYLTELADRIVYLEKGEIKGIYTPEEFRQLSEPDREHMGLRAVDLQAVFPPKPHSIAPIPVLELRNVTLSYKKRTILHDIGLSAGKGEVIGVVGHNGAGKTTFSRALCGLHKDCDGQFLWERKPIERKERLKRSYMVIENHLREKDYSFDYAKQPSKAMFKYRKAFLRNDGERYNAFLEAVSSGEKQLHADNLAPYEIVRSALDANRWGFNARLTDGEKAALNASWASLPDFCDNRNALAVVDTSGSMYCYDNALPAAVALSLGLYFGERNTGIFHNHFIEFSSRPQLIEIKGKTFAERLEYLCTFNEVADTNVEAVFDLILDAAVRNNVPQEELPETLYLISDMEFNACVRNASVSNFASAKRRFAEHGYRLPQIVFWNVASRNSNQPVTKNEQGVALVSGCTPRLFSMVASGDLSPYSVMMDIIESERYAKISA